MGVNIVAEQKRVEWIDIARGLGILFVIIGHTMTTPIRCASNCTYMIYYVIYFFHMPFMFYLSGRTFGMFQEKNLKMSGKQWIQKKWSALMVPYIVYGTVVYVIFTAANSIPKLGGLLEGEGYGKQSVLHWLRGMVTMYGEDLYSFHLWYIYGLFLMSLFSFFVMKYRKAHKVILFGFALFCISFRILYINVNYWGIVNLFMKCYFWFVLGTYVDLSEYAKKIQGKIWAVFGIVYAIWYIYIKEIKRIVIPAPPMVLEMIKWIADIGIILGLIWTAMHLTGVIKRFFDYTGKNSYGIYLFHQPFFASGAGAILYKVFGLPLAVAIGITFVLCYVAPLTLVKMLDWKYLSMLKPYFLGSKKKK